jgi:integrase
MAHLIKRPNGIFAVQFKNVLKHPRIKRWSLGTRDALEAAYLFKQVQEDSMLGYDPWCGPWYPGWRHKAFAAVVAAEDARSKVLPQEILFSEGIARYKKHLIHDLKKPATIEKADYVLNHFTSHFPGDSPLTEVVDTDVHRFLYSANQYRKRTIKEYRGVISRFFKWCVSQGFTSANPCDGVKTAKKSKKIPKYLMPDEVDHHCETIRQEDAAKPEWRKGVHLWLIDVIRADVYLALRRSEITNLDLEHINWTTDPLLLKVVVDEDKGIDTKDSKERVIPVHPEAAVILLRLRQKYGGKGPVFRCAKGNRIRPDHLTHLFQEYRVKAGLADGVTVHSLRHTALSWLAMLGADIETIRMFGGHEDYETSQLYLHLAPRIFRDNALNCFNRVHELRGVQKEELW